MAHDFIHYIGHAAMPLTLSSSAANLLIRCCTPTTRNAQVIDDIWPLYAFGVVCWYLVD